MKNLPIRKNKSTMVKATAKDFGLINDLLRIKNKKYFSFVTKEQIQEFINLGFAYISDKRNYCEVFRIYKRKTKIADGEKSTIIAKPGDVNLLYAAALKPGEGIGTKYRKIFLEIFDSPGRVMFSILRHDNLASETYNKKCGLEYLDTYTKNGNKYKVFIWKTRKKFRL